MIEPVLDVDEALDSELVREREMVVEWEQPELGPVRQLGVPVKLSRTPGTVHAPAPALGEHTREVLRDGGLRRRGDRRAARVGRRGGPGRRSATEREVHGMSAAAQPRSCSRSPSSPSAPTSRWRPCATTCARACCPEPVKTSRNMAYYPPEFAERIRLIKQLQEERFLPLRVIRELLDVRRRRPRAPPRPGRAAGTALLARALGRRARADPRRGGRAAVRDPGAGAATGSPSSGC